MFSPFSCRFSLGSDRLSDRTFDFARPKEIAFVSAATFGRFRRKAARRSFSSRIRLMIARAFLADGRRLAFVSKPSGRRRYLHFESRTSDLQRLTFDDAATNSTSVARRAMDLFFLDEQRHRRNEDIHRVSASGGTPMQISADRYTNEFGRRR